MRKIASTAIATALLLGASSLAMAQMTAPSRATSTPSSGSSSLSSSTSAINSAAQANQKLEASGYTDVKNVSKASDGWAAKAMKDGQQVSLIIDNSGKISVE